jgi:NitT/TauT family transport system substrate-binding protein
MRYRYPAMPAAVAAVAIALLSGGCSGNSAAASGPPVEKHNLVVGAVPVADSAALYIAQQRGFSGIKA